MSSNAVGWLSSAGRRVCGWDIGRAEHAEPELEIGEGSKGRAEKKYFVRLRLRVRVYSSSSGESPSFSPLCTFLCRRKFETTEKCRPQPSTSHANAIRRSVLISRDSQETCNLRFSPVWLYMCVCREEGRVNRLSHTLHLCFFCVFEGIFELN
jgi:hypothetical protein